MWRLTAWSGPGVCAVRAGLAHHLLRHRLPGCQPQARGGVLRHLLGWVGRQLLGWVGRTQGCTYFCRLARLVVETELYVAPRADRPLLAYMLHGAAILFYRSCSWSSPCCLPAPVVAWSQASWSWRPSTPWPSACSSPPSPMTPRCERVLFRRAWPSSSPDAGSVEASENACASRAPASALQRQRHGPGLQHPLHGKRETSRGSSTRSSCRSPPSDSCTRRKPMACRRHALRLAALLTGLSPWLLPHH